MRAAWETHREPEDPAAGVELDSGEAMALSAAVEFHVARRFAAADLDTDTVATMRSWSELADRLSSREGTQAGRLVVLAAADIRRLYEATGFYLAEIDVPAYQPPELRERIAALYTLRCELEQTLSAVPEVVVRDTLALK